MIGSQPAIFAAISADNPTAPTPNIAMLSPGCGFMTFKHGAGAGLAAAGERAEQLERRVAAHFDGVALLAQGERAERGLLKECAVNRRAVLRQAASIHPRAFLSSSDRGRACSNYAGAVGQFAQLPHHGYDMTTWSPGTNVRTGATDRVDHAGTFVPVNSRVGRYVVTITAVQIGLAHPAGHDTYDQLVSPGRAEFQSIDDERTRPFP